MTPEDRLAANERIAELLYQTQVDLRIMADLLARDRQSLIDGRILLHLSELRRVLDSTAPTYRH